MQFTPKSEKQLQEESLMPPGIYDFEVVTAEDKRSSKGNDMIEVQLRVFTEDGGSRYVRDYLMEAMAFKLRHFADATGLTAAYESGSLVAADCAMRSGKVKIKTEKDKSGQYPDKAAVADYIVADAGKPAATTAPPTRQPAAAAAGTPPIGEEDIPF